MSCSNYRMNFDFRALKRVRGKALNLNHTEKLLYNIFSNKTQVKLHMLCSGNSTAVASAMLLYSASVLLLDTTCRFSSHQHQETELGPRNTEAPEVDLPSSRSEPQSVSQ
ncbi:hypothetical protein QL285_029533 [Trifolium repens]|nr:hypothetical protein QL285_029533 [Trifolium repens]